MKVTLQNERELSHNLQEKCTRYTIVVKNLRYICFVSRKRVFVVSPRPGESADVVTG